jgi:hypothetical protein
VVFAFRSRVVPFIRAAEPYRFLKQERHRASRLFLKDGERSSLPQYLQANFPTFDGIRDDRRGRFATFLVFEATVPFGLAATTSFLAAADFSSTGDEFRGPAILLLLLLTSIPAACLVSIFN